MFEPVEHQQHLTIVQDLDELASEIRPGRTDSEPLEDLGRDHVNGIQASKRNRQNPVAERQGRGDRRLDRQARLAHSPGAGDRNQPSGRILQQVDQFLQLGLPADEPGARGERRKPGWGSFHPGARLEGPSANVAHQAERLLRRFDPQLLPQNSATGFELCQGLAPPTGKCQQPNTLPVGFLHPRVERQLPPYELLRHFEIARGFVEGRQTAQRIDHLPMESLTLDGSPLLKRTGLFQVKCVQEVSPVQANGLLTSVGARAAVVADPMRVASAGFQQAEEVLHVESVFRGQVESDRVPAYGQEGGLGRRVFDCVPQVGQGLAKIHARGRFALLGPQQADQGLAGVVSTGVHRQIDQEGTRLLEGEAGDRPPVQRNGGRPEQGQIEAHKGGHERGWAAGTRSGVPEPAMPRRSGSAFGRRQRR